MRKKLVLTGTSGTIGSSIYEILRPHYDIVSIDRLPSKNTTLIGDILDRGMMRKALEGAWAVVHTAAYHAPHVGRVSEEEFTRVNVEGTRLLVGLAEKAGVKKFIFTSTTALYGPASQKPGEARWITEETTPIPKTIYHRTKIDAENFLEKFARETGVQVCVIRMSRCFPEPANLMAVYRLHRGVDARDVAVAHKLALENDSLPVFERFIVSGSTPFTPADCVDLYRNPESILESLCPELMKKLRDMGYPDLEPIDRVYDSSRVQSLLGWCPEFGPEEVFRQLEQGRPEVLLPR